MLKRILLVLATVLYFSQTGFPQEVQYDSMLSKKLGADDYGMKKYVIAFLKTGPVTVRDPEEVKKIQTGHMNNINRMADEGKLVIAGPFLDDQDIKGIYIFDVSTVEEAKTLTETDPAIIAGVFQMELHPWYGSAALAELYGIHKKIQKSKF